MDVSKRFSDIPISGNATGPAPLSLKDKATKLVVSISSAARSVRNSEDSNASAFSIQDWAEALGRSTNDTSFTANAETVIAAIEKFLDPSEMESGLNEFDLDSLYEKNVEIGAVLSKHNKRQKVFFTGKTMNALVIITVPTHSHVAPGLRVIILNKDDKRIGTMKKTVYKCTLIKQVFQILACNLD